MRRAGWRRGDRSPDARSERGPALVTGASRGIGRAVAITLAQEGFQVLAGVRTPEAARALAAAHPRIEPIPLDVTVDRDVAALGARLETHRASLALLVNNAAVAAVGPIELVAVERWRQVMAVNLLGAVAVTQVCLPALFRAHGRVVNVGSPAGRVALPMFGSYVASKFALEGFTDTLQRECARGGVSVVGVTPGPIGTDLIRDGLDDGRDLMSRTYPPPLHHRYGRQATAAVLGGQDVLTGRGGTPQDAAAVVVRAALARRPRRRYRQGVGNHAAAAIALLPGSIGDRIVRRATEAAYVPPREVRAGRAAPYTAPPRPEGE